MVGPTLVEPISPPTEKPDSLPFSIPLTKVKLPESLQKVSNKGEVSYSLATADSPHPLRPTLPAPSHNARPKPPLSQRPPNHNARPKPPLSQRPPQTAQSQRPAQSAQSQRPAQPAPPAMFTHCVCLVFIVLPDYLEILLSAPWDFLFSAPWDLYWRLASENTPVEARHDQDLNSWLFTSH